MVSFRLQQVPPCDDSVFRHCPTGRMLRRYHLAVAEDEIPPQVLAAFEASERVGGSGSSLDWIRDGVGGSFGNPSPDLVGDRITIPPPIRTSDAVPSGRIDQHGCRASVHAEGPDPGDIVTARLQIAVGRVGDVRFNI